MNKKILIPIFVAGLIAVLAGAGYFYWKGKSKITEPPAQSGGLEKADSGEIGDKIKDGAVKGTLPSLQTNPLEDKPDLNPVDKTNPYSNIKTNPFK